MTKFSMCSLSKLDRAVDAVVERVLPGVTLKRNRALVLIR
jgi:hypothetical protein